MILCFKNDSGEEKEIGQPMTYKEAMAEIHKYLEELKFKSYYTRVYKEPGSKFSSTARYVFDVGFHTEFFILEGNCVEIEKALNSNN